MSNHANTHHGALPDTSNLFAALANSLDRGDADQAKLANKIMEQHQLHLIGTKVVAQRAALEPGGSVAAGGGSGASPTCIKVK
uniref:Uncharacterized protein n=1 Tax=Oryza barthii TaxID=65489 RepID=A0A0D3H4Q7_9ORYZ